MWGTEMSIYDAHERARFGAIVSKNHLPPNFSARVAFGLNAMTWTHQIGRFFDAWVRAEGGDADWNPLNSTLWVQNFTNLPNYNDIPVRNYASPNAGVAATVLTLSQHNSDGSLKYGKIVNEIQNNFSNNRTAEQMVQNCQDQIHLWGTDPQLMLEILAGI